MTLCSEDTTATWKPSDISLEHDEHYVTTIDEWYARTTLIPYTKV